MCLKRAHALGLRWPAHAHGMKFAAPWPAFLEVSTPRPSPNPNPNPSLNLSLSLSSIQLGPPACTPPPFHCLGKHSLCNIISFSSTFKIQEILFSLQTCTFLKKRRFSEDVVFQKTTSRLGGRYRIRHTPLRKTLAMCILALKL